MKRLDWVNPNRLIYYQITINNMLGQFINNWVNPDQFDSQIEHNKLFVKQKLQYGNIDW